MKHILYSTIMTVFLVAGCTPTAPLMTDVGLIDSVPSRALASSPAQQEATAALLDGMREMSASAGAVVILDANTGQVISLVSIVGKRADDAGAPQFNRAVNNVHEVGRAMAIFPIAQALDEGLITTATVIDTPPALSIGRFQIRDFNLRGGKMSISEVFVSASNVGTAQISQKIDPERQQDFLDRLGFLESNQIEERFPTAIHPLRPPRWGQLSAATVSIGYGLTVSPLQLATAYASIVNGGTRVYPTLGPLPRRGERVLSQETSTYVRELLRESVGTGTARLADFPAYSIGGATGTSQLRLPHGGNSNEKFVATFAGAFPIEEPQYIVVILLEDPVFLTESDERRTAIWTSAPVARKIVERVGPLLILD